MHPYALPLNKCIGQVKTNWQAFLKLTSEVDKASRFKKKKMYTTPQGIHAAVTMVKLVVYWRPECSSWRKGVVFFPKWPNHKINLPLGRLSVPRGLAGTFSTKTHSLHIWNRSICFSADLARSLAWEPLRLSLAFHIQRKGSWLIPGKNAHLPLPSLPTLKSLFKKQG